MPPSLTSHTASVLGKPDFDSLLRLLANHVAQRSTQALLKVCKRNVWSALLNKCSFQVLTRVELDHTSIDAHLDVLVTLHLTDLHQGS